LHKIGPKPKLQSPNFTPPPPRPASNHLSAIGYWLLAIGYWLLAIPFHIVVAISFKKHLGITLTTLVDLGITLTSLVAP
jgi:hypothetical protein